MNRYQIALARLDERRETPPPLDVLRASGRELPLVPTNWEWDAPHLSRRISGISEQRARDLAARNGGSASRMSAARQ